MKHKLIIFHNVALATSLFAFSAIAGDIQASVVGAKSKKGHVICGLFCTAEGFPKDSMQAVMLLTRPADPSGVSCNFLSLSPGDYAVSVFHDENDDGILNANLIGMPLEGYGASNNNTHATRSPGFEESKFSMNTQPIISLRIQLKY